MTVDNMDRKDESKALSDALNGLMPGLEWSPWYPGSKTEWLAQSRAHVPFLGKVYVTLERGQVLTAEVLGEITEANGHADAAKCISDGVIEEAAHIIQAVRVEV